MKALFAVLVWAWTLLAAQWIGVVVVSTRPPQPPPRTSTNAIIVSVDGETIVVHPGKGP